MSSMKVTKSWFSPTQVQTRRMHFSFPRHSHSILVNEITKWISTLEWWVRSLHFSLIVLIVLGSYEFLFVQNFSIFLCCVLVWKQFSNNTKSKYTKRLSMESTTEEWSEHFKYECVCHCWESFLLSTYKSKTPPPLFEKHLNNNTFDQKQKEQPFGTIQHKVSVRISNSFFVSGNVECTFGNEWMKVEWKTTKNNSTENEPHKVSCCWLNQQKQI